MVSRSPFEPGYPDARTAAVRVRRAEAFSPGIGWQAPIGRSIELQAIQVRRPTSVDQEPRTTSLPAKILLNIHVP